MPLGSKDSISTDCLGGFLILLAIMQLGASATYIGFVAILITAGASLIDSRQRGRIRTAFLFSWKPLLVLGIYLFVASVVMATNRTESLKSWGELKWAFFFLVSAISAVAIASPQMPRIMRRTKMVYAVFIAVSVFSGLSAFYQFCTETDPFREYLGMEETINFSRGHGLLQNPVPFGKMICSFLLLFLAAAVVSRRASLIGVSVLSTVLAGICMVATIASQARGVWLSLVVVGAAALFLSPKRIRLAWNCSVWICVIVLVMAVSLVPKLSDRAKTITSDTASGSNRVRIEQWHANWIILKRNPFGVGFDGNDAREEKVYQELGYTLPNKRGHCHNEYIEIAVATGWIGISVYLVWTGLMLYACFSALHSKVVGTSPWMEFLLLSSFSIQILLGAAVMTDQMDTQSRMLMTLCWAVGSAGWCMSKRSETKENIRIIPGTS